MARFRSEVPRGLFRVPISITKDMEAWLQSLSNEMKSSGGYKLPKSYIIRALLDATMDLKIDVDGVKTEDELVKRILKAIKDFRK
jgi:ribosome maturation protein Sdo1